MKRLVGCISNHRYENRPNNIEPVEALLVLDALYTKRDTHATADAERSEALRAVATLQLEQQCVENTRTGGANWMADGNCATIHIDYIRVEPKILVDGAGLCRKRLVCLNKIKIFGCPTRPFQGLCARPGSVPFP